MEEMKLEPCQLCLDCGTACVNYVPDCRYIIKDSQVFCQRSCTERFMTTYLFNPSSTFYHQHTEPKYTDFGLLQCPDEAYDNNYTIQYEDGHPSFVQRTHGPNGCGSIYYWIPWHKFCKCDQPDIFRVINTVVPVPVPNSFTLQFSLKQFRQVIDNPRLNWEKYTKNQEIYHDMFQCERSNTEDGRFISA